MTTLNTTLSTLWKHRRKIAFAGMLGLGALRRVNDKNTYTEEKNGNYSTIKFNDKNNEFNFGTIVSNILPLAGDDSDKIDTYLLLREFLGATIVSAAPVTCMGLAGGLKILESMLEKNNECKNEVLNNKMKNKGIEETDKTSIEIVINTKKKIKKDTAILKCNGQELGQLIEIGDENAKPKETLTIFYNHGNAENLKKSSDSISDKLIAQLSASPYKKINYVRVKQGYEQDAITSTLIEHFNLTEGDNVSLVGFSAGCTSSLEQEQIMKAKGITLKSVILTAPVIDGIGVVMPASVRWLMKPLEKVVLKSGLLRVGNGSSWNWTCGEALSKADKIDNPSNLKILYSKNDEFYKHTYIPQRELLKAHLPNRDFDLKEYNEGNHNDKHYYDDVIAELLK